MAGYPGGAFDPLGLASGSAASVADWRLKEIKNARLAMLAFLGFIAQHAATGKGPIENLTDVSSSIECDTMVPFFPTTSMCH